MFSASDLRKGLKIEVEGTPYVITEYNFMKPGKGQAIYTCRIKSMIDGSTQMKQYRSNDKIDKPELLEKKLVYTYKEADDYVFMDENFEQIHLSEQVLGDQRYFLKEEIEVDVLFHNGQPIGIELPIFVERKIEFTEPGAKGNTAFSRHPTPTYPIVLPLFTNRRPIHCAQHRSLKHVFSRRFT